MSTLVQIEEAVAALPSEEQRELMHWLGRRLEKAEASRPDPGENDGLAALRELQREMQLTPSSAAAWKAAVRDSRR